MKVLKLTLAFCLLFAGTASAKLTPDKLTEEQAIKGKPVYERLCAGCHGMKGKGDGPAAERLRPKPRDFRRAVYKYTYVEFGKRPQDSTLYKWVADGLPGTSMPGWKDVLKENEIWNVVAYIKTLTKKFKRDEKKGRVPKPISIGTPPQWTEANITNGKELFDKNCEKCHGKKGKGSGPSAVSLQDDGKDRIWPRNLTKGWTFRGGTTPEDIYRTVATGVSGTPMPAHLEVLKENEIWNVVGYLDSIVQRERPKIAEVLISKSVEGDLPTDPSDERWNAVEKRYFPLVSQIIEGNRWFKTTLESVYAKSLYNDKGIAIYVEWDDPSGSPLEIPVEMFPENTPDAVAVQLPTEIPTGLEKPYFLGGSQKTPVILWKWTNGQSGKQNGATFISTGITRQNPAVDDNQAMKAAAKYENGTWKAVFVRPLAGSGENDLTIEIGKYIPVAFNAWDGNNGEKEEMRAVSVWYWLLLEPPKSMKVYLWPVLIGLLVVVGEAVLVIKAKKS